MEKREKEAKSERTFIISVCSQVHSPTFPSGTRREPGELLIVSVICDPHIFLCDWNVTGQSCVGQKGIKTRI